MEPHLFMHYDLGAHPTKDTIRLITMLLDKIIHVNDTNNTVRVEHETSTADIYTCFHARAIPNISIHAYLTRILKYCPCTNECFLAILVYFDRMAKPDPPARTLGLRIDSYNIHRFIIAGVMIASKLFSDVFFTNARYAKVGGVPVSELNVLEIEFLALNDYKLFVTIEELQHYGDQLLLHRSRDMGNSDNMKRQLKSRRTDPFRSEKGYKTRPQQQLKGTSILGTLSHSTPTVARRRSDDIDLHRLFKRPSFRVINSMHNTLSTDRQFDIRSTLP